LEVKSWGSSAMEGCCEGSQGPPRTAELEINIIPAFARRRPVSVPKFDPETPQLRSKSTIYSTAMFYITLYHRGRKIYS
jgi:hypothetical protein